MPAVAPSYYRHTHPLGGKAPLAGLGVCVHYVGAVNALTAAQKGVLADLGAKYVRTDLFWGEIETAKGTYNWTKYDSIVADLLGAGIRPYFILCYANPLYYTQAQIDAYNAQASGPKPYGYGFIGPANDDQRAAYAAFAAAAVSRYKGKGVVWELWNEPNLKGFWAPAPDAGDYALMAIQAARAMRLAAPDEWIVGPALANYPTDAGYSGIDLAFLDQVCRLGLLEWIDGVSCHPYDNADPSSIEASLKAARAVVDKYKPRRKTIVMLAGEVGWSDAWSGYGFKAPIPHPQPFQATNGAAGTVNKILYSNDFSGVDWGPYWTKPALTTGVADPFGGTGATRLAPTDGGDGKSSGLVRKDNTLVLNSWYCVSVWVRSTSGPMTIYMGVNDYCTRAFQVGERWQRISAVGQVQTGEANRVIQVYEAGLNNAAWEVYGAQAEAIPAPTTVQTAADREQLSADAVRSIVLGAHAGGAMVTMLYDLQNDGDDPANQEHAFGLTRSDGSPKPAYHAVVGLQRAKAKWGA